MALEPDIEDRVRRDFRPEASAQALDLIRQYGETGRVARCAVVASRGALDLLKGYLLRAESDFRDVILAGEYDGANRRIRDLSLSFLLDAPATFWIAETTGMMALRG